MKKLMSLMILAFGMAVANAQENPTQDSKKAECCKEEKKVSKKCCKEGKKAKKAKKSCCSEENAK